jgi:hypothetical protein
MSENLHDIEDLFRDAIEDQREMPDTDVWDSIDHRLDKKIIVKTERKYFKLKRLSVALLLLFIGTIAYEFYTKKNTADNINTALNIKQTDAKHNIANTIAGGKKISKQENNTEKIPGKVSGTGESNHSAFSKKVIPVNIKHAPENNPAINSVTENIKEPTDKTTHSTEKTIGAAPENNINRKGNTAKSKPVNKYGRRIRPTQQKEMNDETVNGVVDQSLASVVSAKVERSLKDAAFYFPHSVQTGAPLLTHNMVSATSTKKIVVLKKTKPIHFTVMPFFSPQFGFNRILDDDDHNNASQGRYERDDIRKDEKVQLSYSLGILIEIPLKKRWSLQSGLDYTNKNLNIEPKKIYAQLDNNGEVKYRFDCSCGFTYLSPKTGTTPAVGDSIVTTGSTNNLQYIGIPLTINYTFFKGKFNIVPSFGAAVNFLIKQKIETSLTGASSGQQSITDIQGLKKIYFNTVAGIALQYQLNKKISVNITPAANFALSSINRNAAVKSYPNSFAVAAGIKIQR